MKNEPHSPILTLKQVRKEFVRSRGFSRSGARHVVALDGVNLSVNTGEIFGLVGESGSGKTTLGRLIVRLELPTAGSVRFRGNDIRQLGGIRLKKFRRQVQMIFQDPYESLNPRLSVYHSVVEPLEIHKKTMDLSHRDSQRELVVDALNAVGLTPPQDYLNRYPHELSGGQRQRVAIARAMILKPDLIVADEPTSMLDASIAAQIFHILRQIRQQLGATLIYITHNVAAARHMCDRLAVIYKGTIVETGLADHIIHHPVHPYTRALMDALPRFGRGPDVPVYDTLLSRERHGIPQNMGCAFMSRCKLANPDLCSNQPPELRQLGPEHFVACFCCTQASSF